MPVELENKTDGSIPVAQLTDGRIGLITKWERNNFLGMIVQRVGYGLIVIGEKDERSWDDIRHFEDSCRVQVLKNGTKLTITDNE